MPLGAEREGDAAIDASVGIRWNPYESVGIRWDLLEFVGIDWISFESNEIH